jgi:hypothetical protein
VVPTTVSAALVELGADGVSVRGEACADTHVCCCCCCGGCCWVRVEVSVHGLSDEDKEATALELAAAEAAGVYSVAEGGMTDGGGGRVVAGVGVLTRPAWSRKLMEAPSAVCRIDDDGDDELTAPPTPALAPPPAAAALLMRPDREGEIWLTNPAERRGSGSGDERRLSAREDNRASRRCTVRSV